MNSLSDIGPALSGEKPGVDNPPANWREALMALIAARVALIQLEAKDSSKEIVRRVLLIAIACGCAFFAWALLLTGGVSLISESTGWPWNLVAVGMALLHLLVSLVLILAAKPSGNSQFPVTRAEFKKDREWIENFHTTSKSSD